MYIYGVYVLIHQSTPENPPLYLKNNLVMFYIPTKDTIFVTVFLQDNLLCFPIHARPTQGFHSWGQISFGEIPNCSNILFLQIFR